MLNRFFFLAAESIKNPKKFFYVLYKKLFSIPTLEFLRNLKYKKIKFIYLKFWYFFSKKNKNFKRICFEENEFKNIYRFTFDRGNFLNKKIIDSLSYNGIVVVENILSEKNLKIFKSLVDEIKNGQNEIINSPNIKKIQKNISEDKKRERIACDFQDKNFEELDYICEKVSELFYGRKLIPTKSLYIDKCFDVPEAKIRGDNYLHIDRFLPNLKILFSPYSITNDDAPFVYSLNSHKINTNYINFLLNTKNFDETDSNAENFKKNKLTVTVKENSAIIAVTNGFHGRTSFKKNSERIILFHQFNKAFGKLSYLNFFRYNNNKL